jgi:translation initiation factor IF-3
VEVAAAARPPVVRIMDYGKFKFEQAKQARLGEEEAARDPAQGSQVPSGHRDHDFDTKTRHARRFLEEGNKVKVTLMFRGRQIAHPELGARGRAGRAAELADVAKVESAAKGSLTMILGRSEVRRVIMILTPVRKSE